MLPEGGFANLQDTAKWQNLPAESASLPPKRFSPRTQSAKRRLTPNRKHARRPTKAVEPAKANRRPASNIQSQAPLTTDDTTEAVPPAKSKRQVTFNVESQAPSATGDAAQAAKNAATREWRGYRNKVKQLAESHNEVLAQRGRHLDVLADWYTADTALADIPITLQGVSVQDLAKRYEEGRVHIRHSVLTVLAKAPVHADITAMAAFNSVDMHGLLHTLWPTCTAATPPDLLVCGIAASLFTDTASVAVDQKMEVDTKLVSVRVLADAVAFFGKGFRFTMETAHDLGNSCNSVDMPGLLHTLWPHPICSYAVSPPACLPILPRWLLIRRWRQTPSSSRSASLQTHTQSARMRYRRQLVHRYRLNG
ncbi:hypothetical protein HDU88_007829 [Geranomyces variabilis]|nr:hypothetical protein HDU88_007829 [Geranomyces variabilis]